METPFYVIQSCLIVSFCALLGIMIRRGFKIGIVHKRTLRVLTFMIIPTLFITGCIFIEDIWNIENFISAIELKNSFNSENPATFVAALRAAVCGISHAAFVMGVAININEV